MIVMQIPPFVRLDLFLASFIEKVPTVVIFRQRSDVSILKKQEIIFLSFTDKQDHKAPADPSQLYLDTSEAEQQQQQQQQQHAYQTEDGTAAQTQNANRDWYDFLKVVWRTSLKFFFFLIASIVFQRRHFTMTLT